LACERPPVTALNPVPSAALIPLNTLATRIDVSAAPPAEIAYDIAGITRAATEILDGFEFASVASIEIVTFLSSRKSECVLGSGRMLAQVQLDATA
jgi:hypothetical protein